jgi:hypothetical protein
MEDRSNDLLLLALQTQLQFLQELPQLVSTAVAEAVAEAIAPKQTLGFGSAPKAEVWIFCNRDKGGLWYLLDNQSQSVNIEHSALTGYIRKVEFKKVIRRDKEVDKFYCIIEGDQRYILESGSSVHFTKGILSAIAEMSEEQLKQPISIVPSASTQNEEVLFANIYQNEKQVFAPYNDQTDWRAVSIKAIKALRAINPQEYQKSE